MKLSSDCSFEGLTEEYTVTLQIVVKHGKMNFPLLHKKRYPVGDKFWKIEAKIKNSLEYTYERLDNNCSCSIIKDMTVVNFVEVCFKENSKVIINAIVKSIVLLVTILPKAGIAAIVSQTS